MRKIAVLLAGLLVMSACGAPDKDELVLLTHDSFAISEGVLEAFTEETGIEVTQLSGGDAGTMVTQAVLNADNPIADVMYGIDNTFLTRSLDLFVEYESDLLADVPDSLIADPRVTPINYGDVCLNYDKAAFDDLEPPTGLASLIDPAYQELLVVQNPATSSPGLAFLLGTIAQYGETGWQPYWRQLIDNGVIIAPDWETAYYTNFSGGGGSGSAIVVSYASSPPAGVIFAEEPLDEAPTATVTSGCFRQVEYAGILIDSPQARELVDFMLSLEFQEDIPLNMFVFPANSTAELPAEFVEHTEIPSAPLTLDPAVIDANRERWIDEWTTLVTP